MAGSIVAGFLSLYSLVRERYRTAVVGAAAAVTAVIWGWAVAQYPYLVPPTITIEDAKAPANVLWLLIATIGVRLAAARARAGVFVLFVQSRADKRASQVFGNSRPASCRPMRRHHHVRESHCHRTSGRGA